MSRTHAAWLVMVAVLAAGYVTGRDELIAVGDEGRSSAR